MAATDWADDENGLIDADEFAILPAHIAGDVFVKAG
jgi:hypothetical protein